MTGKNDLTGKIGEFVGKRFDSFAELEVLLLLAKSPRRSWSADEVRAELQNGSAAEANLTILNKKGFLSKSKTMPPKFRLTAMDLDTSQILKKLIVLARTHRSRIIALIYGRR